jgi:hypothetical protein
MSAIGPVISDPIDVDWDRTSYDLAIPIFALYTDGAKFILRCVVWRDDLTGAIAGHNFEYTRDTSSNWWTAHEAATPEECLCAVHPASRTRAAKAVECFRKTRYRQLLNGTLSLETFRARAEPPVYAQTSCSLGSVSLA